MMEKVSTICALRQALKKWRLADHKIAFVPTMGHLHAGHIKLLTEARQKADKVIVSIFVNPTQFGEGEDFSTYPRTEQDDEQKLKQAGADLLFLPAVDEVYSADLKITVSVPELATLYCGASRPGHFDGVATIVSKLFNMVQPDIAFFGKKDFQQLLLIQLLVQGLNFPIEIVGVETEREADGLAMSSRNGYLSDKERILAPELYRSLCNAKDAVIEGNDNFSTIEQQQIKHLTVLGFKLDYFSICRSKDLQTATEKDKELVIIAAAKLGSPRLIDNISFIRAS